MFAASAAVDNLIPQYVLCNELWDQECENEFNLISIPSPMSVWKSEYSVWLHCWETVLVRLSSIKNVYMKELLLSATTENI